MNGIDPEDPVVKLCAAGVQAEQAGDGERAANLYRQAWDTRTDDLDASIAAHYLARVQPNAAARLHWNRLALEHALAAGESAASFLPSLHLNVGSSLEEAGQLGDAAASYELASAALAGLEGGQADSLFAPIDRARRRAAVGHHDEG